MLKSTIKYKTFNSKINRTPRLFGKKENIIFENCLVKFDKDNTVLEKEFEMNVFK